MTLELSALAHDGAVGELAVVEDVPDVRGQSGSARCLSYPLSPRLERSVQKYIDITRLGVDKVKPEVWFKYSL